MWLFPGHAGKRPLNATVIQRAFTQAKRQARITKPVSFHSLRHSFATQLLESGVNVRTIQALLGHRSLGTTQRYTHVAGDYLRETREPAGSSEAGDAEIGVWRPKRAARRSWRRSSGRTLRRPSNSGCDRRRVVRDVMQCRTPHLGGHLQVCDHCGREKPFYNSCRNRHCPKCQSLEQTRWVEAQTRNLLPVPYFHLVFTVPAGLASLLSRGKARELHAALRGCPRGAPRRVPAPAGSDPGHDRGASHLDPDPGLSSTRPLHRDGRRSRAAARDRWIAARPGFLVPVRVLSRVFRGKLLEHFDHAALPCGSAGISSSLGRRLLQQAAAKEWVVYSKAPMAGPAQVLRYLGRYTHRIAIGNERLVALQDGRVTFRYRDRRRGNEKGLLTLAAPDFVRRFLQHVLPRGFVRVRHFGLQANGCRKQLLLRARQLLGSPDPPSPDTAVRESWQTLLRRLTGRDPSRCPYCERGMLHVVTSTRAPQHTRGP